MKGKMLKILAALACLTLAAGFVACGGDGGNGDVNSSGEEITSSSVVDSSSSEDMDSSDSIGSSSEEVSSDVVEDSSSEDFSLSEEEGDEPFSTEGLVYTLNEAGDAYTVTGYKGTATEVVIASVYNELPVTSIGYGAFAICYELTEIVIPDSVTSIGDYAFQNCIELTEIVIPDSVTSIGDYAFAICYDLTEIVIPDSVTSIEEGVFFFCDALTVYCEVESKPEGWNEDWNDVETIYSADMDSNINIVLQSKAPVVWDCNNNDVAEDGCVYKIMDGVRYSLKDGVATVVGQPCNITVANIPETVTYKDVNYTVTSIGDRAFEICDSLTEIIIPDSVTSIGDEAFSGCSGLTEIVIPDSVTSIGSHAFDNCNALTIYCEAESQPEGWISSWNASWYGSKCPVVWNYNNNAVADDGCVYKIIGDLRYALKDGVATVVGQPCNITVADILETVVYEDVNYTVTSIGERAFAYCYDLMEIVIPNSVTSIGRSAFYNCSGSTEIVIPDSVTSIGNYAFGYCSSLTEIFIPNSVTYIGSSAFFGCSSLTIYCETESQPSNWNSSWNYSDCPVVWDCNNNDVAEDGYIYTVIDGVRYSLKDGVATVVGQQAKIAVANIPETVVYEDVDYTVTSIGEYAFAECVNLTEIIIPDSVTSIGIYAFYCCIRLTEIVIPDSVTSIGEGAFFYCINLTEVIIPDSVTSIGEYAFAECFNLTQIKVAEDNQYYQSINGNLYTKDGKTLIQYAAGKTATSFTIPDSVTSIGDYAFQNCINLTEIVIPETVTSIGDYAFEYCDSLTIYCEVESQPEEWASSWNCDNRPVVWGYTGTDEK